MRLIRAENYKDMSRKAANIISAQIILKPDSVIGLATGASPLGAYEQLVRWYQKGDLDFSGVRTVNLDEYLGLGFQCPQSYRRFMYDHLFSQINTEPSNIHIPSGLATDLDLQLLGLGCNGHIGFNEPEDEFRKGTHIVHLSDSTRKANSRFFDRMEDVPTGAITMGLFDIVQAERVLMVVSGKEKANALKDAFFGPVTPRIPASILQFHANFTLVADTDALSLL